LKHQNKKGAGAAGRRLWGNPAPSLPIFKFGKMKIIAKFCSCVSGMEVPVTSHGEVIYTVLVNVNSNEHQALLKYMWYNGRGATGG
jgi:hypothetical protein